MDDNVYPMDMARPPLPGAVQQPRGDLLPLRLSVLSRNWRQYDEETDAAFREIRLKVLERDDRTCRFCGLRAPLHHEIHHLDDDHANNRIGNLVTACTFCHMCQHIGLAGRNREAVLIWLPELTQVELHHAVRAILVVEHWAADLAADRRQRPETIRVSRAMAEEARNFFTDLRAREARAARALGTSCPLELAQVLMNAPESVYAERERLLGGLRLLPLGRRLHEGENLMPAIVRSWMGTGGAYANLNPRTWISLYRHACGN